MTVLEALVNIYEYVGEDRQITMNELFDELSRLLQQRGEQRIKFSEMATQVNEIEFYGFVRVVKSSQRRIGADIHNKNTLLSLNVELDELNSGLTKVLESR